MLIPREDRSRKTLSIRKPTLIILAASIAGVLCAGPAYSKPPEKAKGYILVQPKAGLSDTDFDEVLNKNKSQRRGKLKNLRVHIVEVPEQAEEAVARALSRNKHIEFAEPDMLVEPIMQANDPKFSSAWHLPKIRATEAWPIVLGDDVTVAILDTGVDSNHFDLQENIVSGWNAASSNSDSSDIFGHGTMVAGTVAAQSNNGLGVTSVAWNANIMPVRITNQSNGYAYWSDIARGLTWAADNGADVANISYSVSNSSSVSSAASYMRNKGGVVVVSAGNTGGNTDTAPNPYMITVSATGSSDTRTSWSSYGEDVDFAAPGSGIWTTTNGGGYSSVSGTSFSSPITAGVVALMMSANPSLSPDEIEAILQDTSVDLGGPEWDMYYGFGRIDAMEAVSMATESDPTDSEPPSVAFASPSPGSNVNGVVSVSVSASDNFGVTKVELYAGNSLVDTNNYGPQGSYEFSWDTEAESEGAIDLKATAYDQAGNSKSNTIGVTVQNTDQNDTENPTVSIANPVDGQTVSGNVGLSASATDNQQVSVTSIYIDGRLKCSGTSSVSCSWNTRKANSGNHAIKARATDVAGNWSETSVNVTVGSSSGGGGKKGKGRK